MYQAFIPPDYVNGPPGTCNPNIYSGDNRGLSPTGGSYRALQQVAVGVNGIVAASTPVQSTGYTYRFSPSVLQNNLIPSSAYNYGYLSQCSSKGIDAYGHASTSGFTTPQVNYNGQNPTIALKGNASDPVPMFSFAINWNFTLTLTPANLSVTNATGTYNVDCYPAHELSVSNQDVYSWVNPANDIITVAACLAGAGNKTGTFQTTVTHY